SETLQTLKMAKRNARNNNEEQTYDDEGVLYVNVDYILSCPAVLKILECVLLIAAMACMGQYEAHWVGYPDKVIFFYVVVCVAWILVFVFYVLMVCTLDKRCPNYDWGLCVSCLFITWWLPCCRFIPVYFLMASAGLMANEASNTKPWNGNPSTSYRPRSTVSFRSLGGCR
ncbi:hypothetical protein QZH41_010418, partial [Actinostola sp. cb2023]